MKIIKQAIGIDISKDQFQVCLGNIDTNQKQQIIAQSSFDNADKGFTQLMTWVKGHMSKARVETWFVMEATGIYYENLAFYLAGKNQKVAVLLPNKVKHYARTLEGKSKTDRLDAQTLTQLALERPLRNWQVPAELMRTLKALTREYHSLKTMTTRIKNHLHAKQYSFQPPAATISRLKQQLELFESQLRQIDLEIHKLIDQDPELGSRIKNLLTIKGVGLITLAILIAETNGFALIENSKQLSSYAGLDVVHRQSGLMIGKTTISKKGNRFIRQALYLPALSAARFNQNLKTVYLRLVEKKNNKKVALIAIARKLLCLIYTLWKSNVAYDPNYKPAFGK